ncbi:MAG: type II secretion system F family protein [Gemmataceae bacterium]
MLSPVVLIPILVFVAIVSLVGVLAFVFREQTPQAVTRLDIIVNKRTQGKSSAASMEASDILRKSAFESDKKSIIDALTPRLPSMERLFEQADCNISPTTLTGVGLLLAVMGSGVTLLAKLPLFIIPFNALVLFSLPWVWLYFKRQARMKKFQSQLSDGLELLARALRSGQSLAAGMHVVAEEMPEPIAVEFGRVFEEQNLGIPIEDSLRNMAERVPNMDLRFFVTSVCIQRQTGGDLAEILDKIGHVVRERFRILGQVKALTGEGRLSGVVLIALPFALFGFMLNTKPDYVKLLWEDPMGQKMLWFALIAQVIGALVIRKIVNIKV